MVHECHDHMVSLSNLETLSATLSMYQPTIQGLSRDMEGDPSIGTKIQGLLAVGHTSTQRANGILNLN